ncbi:C4-dicarboxylate ABC transporter [Kitasatospora sp. NPDC059571]|uniref:SLAC1 family transporter n=1 Tax=Kitasatospora sp. NPDC059571 TaxID=3346871 RepID=UPI0036A16842
MATTLTAAPAPPVRPAGCAGARPSRPDLARLGPNWYAAVMGTAITANGAAALRPAAPWLAGPGEVFWLLAVAATAVLVPARAVHLVRHRAAARAALDDPATAVFHGCPPMALLSLGAATLAVGGRLIGAGPAAAAGLVLWTVGAVYAVAVAATVPYLMITRHRVSVLRADPTWLLPVVAPMVAAATGPALLAHVAAGWRPALLYGCGALFGASLLAVLALLPVVFAALVHGGPPAPVLTPALFLVLGPLGQSATAAGALADGARTLAPAAAGPAVPLAVLYGVVVIGFALLWLLIAAAANLRALRAGMPFAMTWWAYTFPVGTLVTGTASLGRHTGAGAFTVLAGALYVLLLVAWAVTGARTVAGLLAGRLL